MSCSIHKGIAIGEMTRVIRNTTSPSLRDHYGNKLIKHFKRRKYHPSIIKKLKSMIQTPRIRTLNNIKKHRIERPLPFITYFGRYKPSLTRIISKRWRNIYNDHHFYPLYPNDPFTVYKNHKNLKALLSSKRRDFKGNPEQENLQPNKSQPFKFLKFNHPKPHPKPPPKRK